MSVQFLLLNNLTKLTVASTFSTDSYFTLLLNVCEANFTFILFFHQQQMFANLATAFLNPLLKKSAL